jgi:hypothetical protein
VGAVSVDEVAVAVGRSPEEDAVVDLPDSPSAVGLDPVAASSHRGEVVGAGLAAFAALVEGDVGDGVVEVA